MAQRELLVFLLHYVEIRMVEDGPAETIQLSLFLLIFLHGGLMARKELLVFLLHYIEITVVEDGPAATIKLSLFLLIFLHGGGDDPVVTVFYWYIYTMCGTVLQTVQRHGVYSAAYGTVHYEELLKSFKIRGGHSPGFWLLSVVIMPWLCRKRRKAIFTTRCRV